MKSFNRILAAGCLLAALLSCGRNTRIDGVLRDGADTQLVVKLLDVNHFQVLDTVKTGKDGAFRYALDLQEARPEFIYLFYGDRQVASLLLQKGDRVQVETDTLGAYIVRGSDESVLLQKVENAYNGFVRDMNNILLSEPRPNAALSRRYVSYYRDRVSFVMEHSHSLTVVPVLFQQVNPNLAVFSQATDGLLMRNICDSLKLDYPESRYVKALEKEATRRIQQMELGLRMQTAGEVGFIDINLPAMDGSTQSLSQHLDKVTMVYFWASTAQQKMFNLDALVPLYKDFHPRGFEVYAVSLDTDKTAWATAVRNQQLPWVNVCDTRGVQSPYVATYGLTQLPMAWFLLNGEIDPSAKVSTAADIRKYLQSKL